MTDESGSSPPGFAEPIASTDPSAVPPTAPRGDEWLRGAALASFLAVAVLLVLLGMAGALAGPGRGQEPTGEAASGVPRTSETAGAPGAGGSITPPPTTGAAASPAPTVTGQPSAPLIDPVLVGAGDIANCGTRGDEATAALLDGIDGTVFTAGDNAYDAGSPAQFAECYAPTWGRHLDRTRPAPGNHDWSTDRLEGYLGYFGERAAPDGTTWYSYDLGTWHVVVLDSDCGKVGGCGPDSEQGRWLAADLASSDAACTLAIFHHPRWSSGEHGDIEAVAPFWEALHAADADVVVNGHDHDYERFAPQDPRGREDRARGLRQFIVGTGGTPLRDFVRVAPHSELRVKLHGVLAFTLRAGSYDWSFTPTSTDVSDRGTASCH